MWKWIIFLLFMIFAFGNFDLIKRSWIKDDIIYDRKSIKNEAESYQIKLDNIENSIDDKNKLDQDVLHKLLARRALLEVKLKRSNQQLENLND